MDRRSLAFLLLVAACSSGESSSARSGPAESAAAHARPTDGGNREVATASGSAPGDVAAAGRATGALAPNPQGRIPVLEYHVIGGDKNTLYTRTAASYRADLEEAYKLGYRPITIAQMLDKDWCDVPGM